MAFPKKISELPSSGVLLSTDIIPVVNNGVTSKVTLEKFSYNTTKELSNADISTLNTVPVILIDSPGVGKLIQVNSCIVELTYGGGTITGQDTLSLYTISASTFLSGGNERMGSHVGFLGKVGDYRAYVHITEDGFVRENSPLIVTAGEVGDPNPTMNASTSTVKFYINYSIITI